MRKIVLIPEEKIPAALAELKIAMNEQKGTQLFVRYQVIYMLLSGESYEKIGAYTGLSEATLFNTRTGTTGFFNHRESNAKRHRFSNRNELDSATGS